MFPFVFLTPPNAFGENVHSPFLIDTDILQLLPEFKCPMRGRERLIHLSRHHVHFAASYIPPPAAVACRNLAVVPS